MFELPDDLADLERRLAARPRAQPDAALRQRVLASMRDAAQGERRRWPNGAWRFAAGLAAAVVLGAYLSMSAAHSRDEPHGDEDCGELVAATKRLQQLDPDLTEHEARRQALLLQARGHVAAVPVAAPSVGRWLHDRGEVRRKPPF